MVDWAFNRNGSPEMLMELAYRLITDKYDDIKRSGKILLYYQSCIRPDAVIQVDWYSRIQKQEQSLMMIIPLHHLTGQVCIS